MVSTTIKERPILFSAPMVRAILAGRKTQTRRVIKGKGTWSVEEADDFSNRKWPGYEDEYGTWTDMKCPYGYPTDRLWVRETWARVPRVTDNGPKHKAKGDGTGATWRADWDGNPSGFKWKPSIHMPRWASRITLEITGVRVERLNAISEDDAKAEGTENRSDLAWGHGGQGDDMARWAVDHGHRYAFCHLWDSINGDGAWSLNPWVWVVEFKTV